MKFEIYKRGQGKNTRLWSALGLGLIVGLGCYTLYNKFQAMDVIGLDPKTWMWLQTMIPAVLFVVFGLLIFWMVNKPSVADFMISAEGELKKVSWSSRKEIAVSTVVVIVVVVLMALYLAFVDIVFSMFFTEVVGI
ncbi:MAG: preprotein translocase subunit SecE [Phycisphaerae bacterium]